MDSKCQTSGKSYKTGLNGCVSSGIIGLDEMLSGGIPLGHIVVVIGDTGTGKTTLALQYVYDGLRKGESAIYISIEEEKESIIATAISYGWNLKKYIDDGKLRLLKLDLSDIKTTARQVKHDFPQIIKSSGATRLVIDSITLFSMMFDDPIERRVRLVDLNKAIKKAGITALYTSETAIENPIHSKDGIIEYSADGILFLQQSDIAKNIKMMIRVVKMRRNQHDRVYRPYEITETGIIVYPTDIVYQEDWKGAHVTADKKHF